MAETAETTVNEAGAAATEGAVPPADPTPAPQDATPPAQPETSAEAPQPKDEEPEGMGADEEEGESKEEAEKKEGNDVLGAPEKGYDETGIELPEGIQERMQGPESFSGRLLETGHKYDLCFGKACGGTVCSSQAGPDC